MTSLTEYECADCNEAFDLHEPPYDGLSICNECRDEPSYCGTCYNTGITEKDVPVIDYVNGGYIETRYEPCQECGGDG